MPQPTWVSESQPEIGSVPTGVISTGAAVVGAVVGVAVVVCDAVGAALGGSSSSPPSVETATAPIAIVAAAATRPAGDPGAPALGAADAAYQRGQQGVGDRRRQLVGVEDLDRHPGQQAGQPGQLPHRLRALGAAGQVSLEGDPVLGGEGAEDVGAVLVVVPAVGHAAPTPISSRASRRARRA